MAERGDRPDSAALPVTIFGRTYHLRGGDDAAQLERLASLVDRKMREVARATGTADTLKVAILASLNLADDYTKAAGDESPVETGNDTRLARMVTLLDDALAGQSSGST